jgi:hypothetical protein
MREAHASDAKLERKAAIGVCEAMKRFPEMTNFRVGNRR